MQLQLRLCPHRSSPPLLMKTFYSIFSVGVLSLGLILPALFGQESEPGKNVGSTPTSVAKTETEKSGSAESGD